MTAAAARDVPRAPRNWHNWSSGFPPSDHPRESITAEDKFLRSGPTSRYSIFEFYHFFNRSTGNKIVTLKKRMSSTCRTFYSKFVCLSNVLGRLENLSMSRCSTRMAHSNQLQAAVQFGENRIQPVACQQSLGVSLGNKFSRVLYPVLSCPAFLCSWLLTTLVK